MNVRHVKISKFGGCKKYFSWLGQKVNKTIDAYGHDADDFGTDLPTI